ncbi:MAG: twin-arginine translocation signal domain-containing protein [Gammaproteobacteria bacterium]|nr:twin-arginine translocation signal domain-containing protein [Gammaproteobacteria bacterium]MDH5659498.1 twin-arginine translocation signal domain-containing protein [Gammaproteobacteria bacterium]
MSQKLKKSRREFLKGAAAAGGAAVVVAATGQNVAVAAEEIETVSPNKKAKGYQETQHVRDYYDSTRS